MAKNTFRKQSPVAETPIADESIEQEESEKSEVSLIGLFRDPKFKLILGLFYIAFSIFAFFAVVSYLFNGNADQSVVEDFFNTEIRESGREAENWLGLIGAILGYFFVYKGFGIASLALLPIFFIYGVKIVFDITLISIRKTLNYSIFISFWLSFTFGCLVLFTAQEDLLGFLAGGIGYEFASICDELLGVGSFLVVILSMLIFIIVTLNISTFSKNASKEILQDITDDKYEELEEEKEDEEQDELAYENEEEHDLEVDESLWEVKTIEEKVKPKAEIPELELSIENEDLLNGNAIPPKENIPEIESESEPKPEELVEKSDFEKRLAELGPYDPTLDLSHYQYPTLDLMKDYGDTKGPVASREELNENSQKIVQTLKEFDIGITNIKATVGPTVTLYEIVPAPGIKISKISNLSDDIALRLSALGVRIIAPMPGKGTIGMEVPNKTKQMVPGREVLMDEKFVNAKMELPIVFGKTITNEVFVADLATMPHLLMAGATGMGKSVGINMLLTSLLYKKHPAQLKIVMVDPKKVELSVYQKIERHFLAKLPEGDEAIITDTKKVVHTLNSLCIEMDTRYSLLKDAGCRNLKEYNPKFISRRLNPNDGHRFLPYIVVVIDELADLMITAGKEIEMPIARLAQLARAVGIHLVLATQRPSVNVITGLIKANFPARLSFRVTTKIDSKIILDEGGADQLVGKGDMLLKLNSEVVRLQCAFVDTPEVENLVDFIGNQKGYQHAYHLPEYYDENDPGTTKDVDLSKKDPKFEEAARLIVATQQGSTSLIQRKMSLGYARSGRIMDQLEAAGIVGGLNGSKPRDVLIKDERSLQEILDVL